MEQVGCCLLLCWLGWCWVGCWLLGSLNTCAGCTGACWARHWLFVPLPAWCGGGLVCHRSDACLSNCLPDFLLLCTCRPGSCLSWLPFEVVIDFSMMCGLLRHGEDNSSSLASSVFSVSSLGHLRIVTRKDGHFLEAYSQL